ncbi:hypothetical protein, partial [uncultured Fibrobacter sp.]|uniref:hypothetical protein n=1 Tax=uncultured Fibrobacter sp. TaxID=261512 RepID=UPI002805738C
RATKQSCQREKDCFTPSGFAMTEHQYSPEERSFQRPSLRGATAPWQSCQRYVIASKAKQSYLPKRIASPLRVRNDGKTFAMTTVAVFTYTRAKIFLGGSFSRTHGPKFSLTDNFHVKTRQNRFASTSSATVLR